jgi:hypothetical protein
MSLADVSPPGYHLRRRAYIHPAINNQQYTSNIEIYTLEYSMIKLRSKINTGFIHKTDGKKYAPRSAVKAQHVLLRIQPQQFGISGVCCVDLRRTPRRRTGVSRPLACLGMRFPASTAQTRAAASPNACRLRSSHTRFGGCPHLSGHGRTVCHAVETPQETAPRNRATRCRLSSSEKIVR